MECICMYTAVMLPQVYTSLYRIKRTNLRTFFSYDICSSHDWSVYTLGERLLYLIGRSWYITGRFLTYCFRMDGIKKIVHVHQNYSSILLLRREFVRVYQIWLKKNEAKLYKFASPPPHAPVEIKKTSWGNYSTRIYNLTEYSVKLM